MTVPPSFTLRSWLDFVLHPVWSMAHVTSKAFSLANIAHRVDTADKNNVNTLVSYIGQQFDRTVTWDDAAKNAFADRCFDIVQQYAPNFKQSVIDRQMVSPLDLEKTFGLTGGNIFQGAMHLNQLFMLRPIVGFANYRTPIRNLYMCGSAAHPGGGVMGIAGHNAAREMLKRW